MHRYGISTNVAIGNNGTDVNLYVPNGNVGIGTTTPSASLSIDKTNVNQHRALDLENDSITYSMYVDQDNIGTDSWSLFDTTNSQTALRYLPSASGYWQFYTNNTERMRINSSGNVGIGTTNPIGNFNIFGGTGDTTTQDVVQTFTRTSSTGNVLAAKLRLVEGSATTHADLKFQVKTTASSAESDAYYTDAITIKGNTGNVGIGTTNPGGLLHVSSGTSGDAVVIIESDTNDIDNSDNISSSF